MNSVDYDVDHEDEDDTLSQGQRSTNGLRNLRKYKYWLFSEYILFKY